jgi:molybdopterin-synthase adenylyltransferase
MLTGEEETRYSRQIALDGFGRQGQEKLKKARVAIVGVGGLGTPAATYLAAAGIGTLRIIDNDIVELSNLNRQILHYSKNLGQDKVESAFEKLHDLNSTIKVDPIRATVDQSNAAELISGFDVVVDGTDNLETRLALNEAILRNNTPFVHGAVYGFQGRSTTILPGQTPCIRCLYRGPFPQKKPPVLGVTPGVIGVIQATETLKLLLGLGELLTNKLLLYDGYRMTFATLGIKRNPTCQSCGHPVGQ